ncbi:MAG: helix-turn-helix transcriptional regulator [Niabella sp.]|nr:helix-turn-helix transcriptional regulator [Niabella sp.]
MNDDIILQITNRIKDLRKEQKTTLAQVAARAGVTKGLISQIENNRTVPSLPVLLNIINSLGIDLSDFFQAISDEQMNGPIHIEAGEYKPVKKEQAAGCHYNRIISFKTDGKLIDIILYSQDYNAKKKMVSTNAYEFDYMLEGTMEYTIENKKYILKPGDSFYYDASKPHLSRCLSEHSFTMLVVYFFNPS